MSHWEFSLHWPLWVVLLCMLGAASIAFFAYFRTTPQLPQFWKILLGSLRFFSLALLFLLLAEPFVTLEQQHHIDPSVAVLLDNSISAAIRDASVDRKEQYLNRLNTVVSELEGFQTEYWKFDFRIAPIQQNPTIDSLSFDGEQTDIAGALTSITPRIEQKNIRAIVLVSDGNSNSGANPLYSAEQLGLPIYAIPIGDTAHPKDIQVRSVFANEITYVNTTIPINTTIEATGFPPQNITVKLLENGMPISEKQIRISPEQTSYTLLFSYTPKQPGVQKLQISVDPLEGELSDQNNIRTSYVQVLESKRTVLLIAGAPYPDVSFIRSALSQIQDVEILNYTQKKDGSFFEGELSLDILRKAQALILVGYPTQETPNTVLQRIRTLLQNHVPLLFVAAKNVDYDKLRRLEQYLPFRIQSSSQQELLVFPAVPENAITHALMRINGTEEDRKWWNQLPPIFRTELFVTPKPGAEVLSYIKIGTKTFDDPLILAYSFGSYRSTAILGYELYRWKLLGYAAAAAKGYLVPDVFTTFFHNLFRWLTAIRPEKLAKIQTNKNFYARGETVEFLAQVYDEALNPVDNATITVKITGPTEERSIVLNSIGAGRYTANVAGLPTGDYQFVGTIRVQDKLLGQDQSRFSIGTEPLEFYDTRSNLQLLSALAERSGGAVLFASALDQLAEKISSHPGFSPRIVTLSQTIALWYNIWLLLFIIILFGLEWLIRKQKGLL